MAIQFLTMGQGGNRVSFYLSSRVELLLREKENSFLHCALMLRRANNPGYRDNLEESRYRWQCHLRLPQDAPNVVALIHWCEGWFSDQFVSRTTNILSERLRMWLGLPLTERKKKGKRACYRSEPCAREGAFLKDIWEKAHDPAPWGAYMDWLLEQGHFRGEVLNRWIAPWAREISDRLNAPPAGGDGSGAAQKPTRQRLQKAVNFAYDQMNAILEALQRSGGEYEFAHSLAVAAAARLKGMVPAERRR